MQDEARPVEPGRRRMGDVPVRTGQGARLRELLAKRVPELPGGAGDEGRAGQETARRSRSERIGERVLQRSTTRGSFHGTLCSSGLAASYSSVTK